MLIFAKIYATVGEWDDFPHEDSYYVGDNVIAVADGITREAFGNLNLNERTVEEIVEAYPRNSGAAKASKILTGIFKDYEEKKCLF